jgi:hypothetical protein
MAVDALALTEEHRQPALLRVGQRCQIAFHEPIERRVVRDQRLLVLLDRHAEVQREIEFHHGEPIGIGSARNHLRRGAGDVDNESRRVPPLRLKRLLDEVGVLQRDPTQRGAGQRRSAIRAEHAVIGSHRLLPECDQVGIEHLSPDFREAPAEERHLQVAERRAVGLRCG